MKLSNSVAMVVCVVLVVSGVSHGAIINFNFPIDTSQEVAPTVSPATGTGVAVFDTVTNQLDWNITFSGLTTAETGAHFHGPATIAQNAGVQIPLSLGSPKVGNFILSDVQETDLIAGLWYVNIHTVMFPGGEIRGQVVPEPATLSILAFGGLAFLRRRRSGR